MFNARVGNKKYFMFLKVINAKWFVESDFKINDSDVNFNSQLNEDK
jgi:hypothetical protein